MGFMSADGVLQTSIFPELMHVRQLVKGTFPDFVDNSCVSLMESHVNMHISHCGTFDLHVKKKKLVKMSGFTS